MTLHLQKGPRGGRARAAARLAAIPRAAADGRALRVYKPIPLYGAATARLADPGLPLAGIAQRGGWRYLIDAAAGLVFVDLLDDPAIGSAVSNGPAADALNRAAVAAEEQADASADLDVRYFAAGDLGFEALWLHSEAGESFVVDLSADGHRLMPLDAWLATVRQAAMTQSAQQRAAVP